MTARLTVIACGNRGQIDWLEERTHSRLAFIDGGPFLRLSIDAALNEPTLDVERLILDRSTIAETFLEILAALPASFSGDVLRIDDQGHGFLSATGRGGDRVFYALRPDDIRFYLDAHGLARDSVTLGRMTTS